MDSESLAEKLSAIQQELAGGNYDLAAALAVPCADDYPDSGRAQELCGIALHSIGDLAAAQDRLEAALLLVPLSPSGELALASALLAAGKRDLAAGLYGHLAQRRNLPAAYLAPVASGLGKTGQLEAALDVCRRAAQVLPDHDEPLYAMACYMTRLGYPADRVMAVLQRARALAPECMIYQVGIAVLLDSMQRTAEAHAIIAAWREEQLAELGCGKCLVRLGDICRRAGDFDLQATLLASIDVEGAGQHRHCEE